MVSLQTQTLLFFLTFAIMVKLWPGIFLRHGRFLPAMLISAFFLSSCTDDEVCEEATANALRIGFYLADQEVETPVSLNALSIYALGVSDSLVYDSENNVSRVELALNPTNDACGYVFVFGLQSDTLWLDYERETHLISVECGFTMFYMLQQVDHTPNFIFSLGIAEPHVTNDLNEHIKIYLPDPGFISN